ncbi:MAG: transcriptional repressor [Clostridia bacterium]|nr:transcriptional repressor [Clostridia bacterium]
MKSTQSYKTKLKTQILMAFREKSDGLLSASDVYGILCGKGETLNLTTVYRNLDTMTRDGVLMRFSQERTGKAMYKYSGDEGGCRAHLHMKCTECGAIVHLDCHFMSEIAAHAKEAHGFVLSCEKSMLYGICSDCLAKDTEK